MSDNVIETEILRALKEILVKMGSMSDELKQNTALLDQLLQKSRGGGGAGTPMGSADDLQDSYASMMDQIQKGMQFMQLNRCLEEVRDLMGALASMPARAPAKAAKKNPAAKSGGAAVAQGTPQEELTSLQEEGAQPTKDKDGLLKPSDLFG